MNSVDIIGLTFGENCKDNMRLLTLKSIEEIYDIIRDESSELKSRTELLRRVRNYSKERYRSMKTSLPYMCCSHFEPAYRKYDHFVRSVGWVLDIDMEEQMDVELRSAMVNDPRVVMSFTSPNGNGLKLLFLFDRPATDKIHYSEAYKIFTREFGVRYGILDKLDLKNCDVSRITFLCHDRHCQYNPFYEPIRLTDMGEVLSPLVAEDRLPVSREASDKEIPEQVYRHILEKLGTKPRIVKNNPFVPEIILQMVEPLAIVMQEYGIEVYETERVQYGIKVRGKMMADKGEIVIYHGKKGWTILGSARKEVSQELTEVMRQVTEYFVNNQGMV